MKSISRITFVLAFVILSQLTFATNPVDKNYDPMSNVQVEQFLDMKFSDMRASSATKLTFRDRVNFLATKKYLRMQVNKGKVSEEDSLAEAAAGFSFKFGPFLVGFFLGLLGIIIVWAVVPKPRKNAVVSSLIGALVWGVIFGALFA